MRVCTQWPGQEKNLFILNIGKFLIHQGGGADTLKFNLHIIGHAKKGCEFNQKRCELKKFLNICLMKGTYVRVFKAKHISKVCFSF